MNKILNKIKQLDLRIKNLDTLIALNITVFFIFLIITTSQFAVKMSDNRDKLSNLEQKYEGMLIQKDKEFFDMKMKFATEFKILDEDLNELISIYNEDTQKNYLRCDPNRFEVELRKMIVENSIKN